MLIFGGNKHPALLEQVIASVSKRDKAENAQKPSFYVKSLSQKNKLTTQYNRKL